MKLILLLLLPISAFAAEVTWTYEAPTEDCDGNPVEIVQNEAYVSSEPIYASDEKCSEEGRIDPVPENAERFEVVPDSNGKVTMNLPSGEHFIRARSQAASGAWSNLSSQVRVVVAESSAPAPSVRAKLVLDTPYAYQCQQPDGTTSNHSREDTAFAECAGPFEANPEPGYYVQGGRKRLEER